MAKNIPITARVSKGLFGQKVSEPVLNVGKAGVSGNNATRNIPSPTKQQKNPASKKEESTSSYQEGGDMFGVHVSKGAGSIIKGNTRVEYTPPTHTAEGDAAYAKMTKAEQAAADKKYRERNTKIVQEPDKKSEGEKVVTTAKGELFTKDKGDAQTAYDRRGNIRNIKNLTGQEKRNNMRTLRQGGFTDDEGNVIKKGTQAYKDKKAEIKLKKRTDRAKVITSEIENSKNQSTQNIKANRLGGYSTRAVLADERKITAGDKTITQQETDFENKLKTKAEMSQTKSNEVKKAENTKESGVSTITEKEKENDTPMVEPTAKKSANGFFAKKSPLKMKYFK
jgi:hypothetical protein